MSSGISGIGYSNSYESNSVREPAKSNNEAAVAADIISGVNSVKELKAIESRGERVSISEEQLVKAIDRAIKAIESPLTTFDFSIHKETKQIMVKVLNKETGELIREIPHEKTLDLVAKMREMVGIIVDEKR